MRDVKFVRLVLVIWEIFCVTVIGRTKPESGPMSVGRVSLVTTGFGFLLTVAWGAFDCDVVDDPGMGILLPRPLIGIRDWLSWNDTKEKQLS